MNIYLLIVGHHSGP